MEVHETAEGKTVLVTYIDFPSLWFYLEMLSIGHIIASNGKMISEQCSGKVVEGNGRGFI
jgi:hypothetical protein